jgi:plasmid stabilization system protein ParE
VEEARSWYAERSAAAEEGFLLELGHAVAQVLAAPRQWPRYKANTRRYVFKRFPYSLIYKVQGDLVRVLAVAHDSRRVGYWIHR